MASHLAFPFLQTQKSASRSLQETLVVWVCIAVLGNFFSTRKKHVVVGMEEAHWPTSHMHMSTQRLLLSTMIVVDNKVLLFVGCCNTKIRACPVGVYSVSNRCGLLVGTWPWAMSKTPSAKHVEK